MSAEGLSFAADWLELRAPADAAARDARLLDAASRLLEGGGLAVDLGAGTGATVAAFPPDCRWRLVDHDPGLLARATARFGARVETCCRDLADVAGLPLAGARLVTASALLDLMPERWLSALADRLAAEAIPVYAALSYDGSLGFEPELLGDAATVAAFNRHQRRDKGMGAAMGPEAAAHLAGLLGARGFEVLTAPSPWHLESGPLQGALVAGIAAATGHHAWADARTAAAGRCSVGHVDLLALPPCEARYGASGA